MVVSKVLRWSPWGAPVPPVLKRRYLVRLRVARIEGLAPAICRDSTAAVAIRWKGPPKGKGISYLNRRRRRGNPSREAEVDATGEAEWGGIEENEFENVCCFSFPNVASAAPVDRASIPPWEISVSILSGIGGPKEEGKERKLKEVGSVVANLAAWAWAFQKEKEREEKQKQKHDGVEGKESQFHPQRKQLAISIKKDDLIAEAMIHIEVSFTEIRTVEEINRVRTNGAKLMKCSQQDEDHHNSDEQITDDPCSSSDIDFDGGSSSPDLRQSNLKQRFLPWGSRSRAVKVSEEKTNRETQSQSLSSYISNSSNITHDEDHPIGKWEIKEFISRDRQTKLRAQSFFASIDQCNETAGGESACTALVAVIADALHSKGVNMPNKSELDELIRVGSSEWRRLCKDSLYINRFPNKHFDLDTILEAKIKPISVVPEKSFISFFEPESFESLRGAMSFDDVWQEISKDVDCRTKIYIVSWNDHFFVLMVESNACYIIDTLGERLYEGLKKAYMLRFDDFSRIYKLPEVEEGKNDEGENGDIYREICSGKDCCREFIKRFFAAIPLREELEFEKKGQGNVNTALHQRLQIELHFTQPC